MRLIDADNIRVPNDERYKGTLRRLIMQQPTIEAEPVVHCKDCKYWDNGDCYRLKLSRPDDFCSYGERKMILKDLLTGKPIDTIEVRTCDPSGDDMLFGYCRWTGSELISGDGDSYSVDEEVEKWEYNEEKNWLTYWFAAEWR